MRYYLPLTKAEAAALNTAADCALVGDESDLASTFGDKAEIKAAFRAQKKLNAIVHSEGDPPPDPYVELHRVRMLLNNLAFRERAHVESLCEGFDMGTWSKIQRAISRINATLKGDK